jgi:DNA replication ATP-dependent helicase Dna2
MVESSAMSEDAGNLFDLVGRIARISAEPKTAAKGAYLFRGLELALLGDSRRIFLIFPIYEGEDVYDFPLICWEGARISIYGARLNNRLDDGTEIFSVTADSRPILEPFRPISVIEAVEAGLCVRSADVRNRVGVDEPFFVAKGRLIHSLFEYLLQHGDASDDQLFFEAFFKAVPELVSILPGSKVSVDYTVMESEARTHFNNLKEWYEQHRDSIESVSTEVDTISVEWGLKGRADAIFQANEERFVLELKSGRYAAKEHVLQLHAYLLLFAGADSAPSGRLLYTATGKTEKLAGPAPDLTRTLVYGRNKALAVRHSYVAGNNLPGFSRCGRKGKCFSRSGCNTLFDPESKEGARWSSAMRKYYDYWFRLLSADSWAQEGDLARIFDKTSLPERLEEGAAVRMKEIRPMNRQSGPDLAGDVGAGDDLLNKDSELDEDNGVQLWRMAKLSLCGDAVDVNPGEDVILHEGPAASGRSIRGRILSSEPDGLILTAKSPISEFRLEESAVGDQSEWYLDRLPFSRGREVSRHALYNFLTTGADRMIKTVIRDFPQAEGRMNGATDEANEVEGAQIGAIFAAKTKKRKNSPRALSPAQIPEAQLNEDQKAAVREALSGGAIHLVHGPPGTGKTSVLAGIIRACLDQGERVLVTAPTNVALDRLLTAVYRLGVTDFVRIGRSRNASPDYGSGTDRATQPQSLEDLASKVTDFAAFRQRITKTGLIGATAYQSAAHPIFRRQRFDRVIIDEAGQLDEPSTLGPLSLAPRCVLGGDHLQLPPVVREKSDSPDSPGLERSLFERLYHGAPEVSVSRLNMQYRMNKEIQDIPSNLFYDGRLFPAPEVASRRLRLSPALPCIPDFDEIIDPDSPAVFVDVQGRDSGKSRPKEAMVASNIIRIYSALGLPCRDIGIITPYRVQQALIRRSLADMDIIEPDLSVDTVDRFQGGEREVIILSLARSDAVTSFLADSKRLNVSLSRARSKLILLGHGPTLREHALFSSILANLKSITLSVG